MEDKLAAEDIVLGRGIVPDWQPTNFLEPWFTVLRQTTTTHFISRLRIIRRPGRYRPPDGRAVRPIPIRPAAPASDRG